MAKREYSGYLYDVIDHCEKINSFRTSEGVENFTDYEENFIARMAIERALTIIGEAIVQAKNHYPQIHDDISNVPKITGFRNHLVHAYLSISDQTVWDIILHDIPILEKEARAALARLELITNH